jgi:hypothetical protein
MKSKLLALLFVVGSTAFAGPRVFFGVGVGPAYVAAPPPAVAYVGAAPVYPVGPRFGWQAGYWARPPYPHAVWVGPRYFGGHYYRGYWRR